MKIEDLILQFDPPRFDLEEAREILAEHYGLEGELRPLAGERDQNIRLKTDASRLFVLKISGQDQAEVRVDFEAEILTHLQKVAPDLGVPAGAETRTGAQWFNHAFRNGAHHPVRLVTYLEGNPLSTNQRPSPDTFFQMGVLQGAVCRALASFFHPAARATMPWDSSSNQLFEEERLALLDPEIERAVAGHLPRLEGQSLPALQASRAQVIHNDCHTGNVLLNEAGRVSGVIDFGDSLHAPLLQDLAVSASSLAETYPKEVVAAVGELQRGFEAAFPLLPEERALLLDAAILRSLLSVQLCRLKADENPGLANHRQVYEASRQGLLALLGWYESLPKRLLGARPERLIERRRRAMSPTYKLFYDEPLEIQRGSGALVYDASGREYLDCYNNVPSVGHGHPHVVEALRQQAGILNTHTRYLHEAVVTYAERLTATLPPELDMCLLVCTGSEANDLAYSIASTVTGRSGVAVWRDCYHGNTSRSAEFSLYATEPSAYPSYVAALSVPDLYRGLDDEGEAAQLDFAKQATESIEALSRSPHGLAMLMVDSIFDAAGIFTAPVGYLQRLVDAVHEAGGLVVADEVQAGLCRLGDNIWGFQDSGVIPDIVTMGKPMGNGHPIGVVAAKRWILEAFAEKKHYFNTFGGNPVSAAVGNAVLDVIEREAILARVQSVGGHLKSGLLQLQEQHEAIGDVRGKGLFIGIDLVSDRTRREPAAGRARLVVNDLRNRGVLVTATGRHNNVIKIRPPLVFSKDNADRLVEALDQSLSAL